MPRCPECGEYFDNPYYEQRDKYWVPICPFCNKLVEKGRRTRA